MTQAVITTPLPLYAEEISLQEEDITFLELLKAILNGDLSVARSRAALYDVNEKAGKLEVPFWCHLRRALQNSC